MGEAGIVGAEEAGLSGAVAHERLEHAQPGGQVGYGVKRLVGLHLVTDTDQLALFLEADGRGPGPEAIGEEFFERSEAGGRNLVAHLLGEGLGGLHVGEAGGVGLDFVTECPDVQQFPDLFEVGVLLKHLHGEVELVQLGTGDVLVLAGEVGDRRAP